MATRRPAKSSSAAVATASPTKTEWIEKPSSTKTRFTNLSELTVRTSSVSHAVVVTGWWW